MIKLENAVNELDYYLSTYTKYLSPELIKLLSIFIYTKDEQLINQIIESAMKTQCKVLKIKSLMKNTVETVHSYYKNTVKLDEVRLALADVLIESDNPDVPIAINESMIVFHDILYDLTHNSRVIVVKDFGSIFHKESMSIQEIRDNFDAIKKELFEIIDKNCNDVLDIVDGVLKTIRSIE